MPNAKRIKLSYRESAVGGEVKAIPFVSDTAALAAAQHIVLLIHGYNNDTEAAQARAGRRALAAVLGGHGNVDDCFADLLQRSPQLPEHLRPARARDNTT